MNAGVDCGVSAYSAREGMESSASAVTLAPGIIIANWTDATTISE